MRIVLISPSPPLRGGISTHSACLYNELSKNHSVLVISYKKLYPNFLFPGKTQFNTSNTQSKVLNIKSMINSVNPISWSKTAKHSFCEYTKRKGADYC